MGFPDKSKNLRNYAVVISISNQVCLSFWRPSQAQTPTYGSFVSSRLVSSHLISSLRQPKERCGPRHPASAARASSAEPAGHISSRLYSLQCSTDHAR
ncbi:hypothetical protein RvY_17558 [Ramazzottius varieornatus]|uniref:Uncharacterized protein n=1 Tax=Ramazzottius varieornatus TaxID=947166 RepID=A0A1D1W2I4_RAMVA|nr:hypothetical protein RvY_17558 [Ramazzottius varieornatus]